MEKFHSYLVLDNLIDAAVIIGIDGQLYYCNQALSSLCDLPLRQMRKKKNLSDLFQIKSIPILESQSLHSLESATPYEEMDLTSASGKTAHVQISAQPILDISGEKRILLFLHDVTLEAKLQTKYRFELSQKDKKISDISLLLEISSALNGVRDIQSVMRTIACKLLAQNICEALWHFEIGDSEETTPVKTFRSADGESDTMEFSTKALLGFRDFWSSREVKTLRQQDCPDFFKFLSSKTRIEGPTEIVVVSFKMNGAPEQVILFFKPSPSIQTNDGNISLLDLVASQTRIALDSVRFFENSITDGMTLLYNKRYFLVRLQSEINRARRAQGKLSLVFIDIDHFKVFNDKYGHQIGDMVLREVAKATKGLSRAYDVVARYGGEEFVVILPLTHLEGAMIFTERLRKKIEGLILSSGGETLKVTASFGVAMYPDQANDLDSLISLADKALYFAKRSGRNQVKIYGSDCEAILAVAKT